MELKMADAEIATIGDAIYQELAPEITRGGPIGPEN
jgi:hypothetical protein